MSGSFFGSVVLRGANAKTSTLKFELGTTADFGGLSDEADFGSAQNALNQIVGALDAVTDAVIATKNIIFVDGDDLDSAIPTSGDVFERAAVVTFLEEIPDVPQKYHTLNIPAPVIGLFMAANGELRDKVDPSDADLQQYIQQVAQHAFVSDHEQIDDTKSNMGILSGRRVVSRFAGK